jgi:NAD-dependent deacetylase
MTSSASLDDLVTALRETPQGQILVITGAGISLASGIPTFRGTDPGAVWKRDVTELGTFRYFSEDPVGSWRWYLSRFDCVLKARPNPAHEAVCALERWQASRGGGWLVVTQNIDTLHEQAGTQRLVKVHGSADRVRCSVDGCTHGAPAGSLPHTVVDIEKFLHEPTPEHLPRCPACGAILRIHVLWFDEFYTSHDDYAWERVLAAADDAAVFLFVGTSFSVGVTDLLLQAALGRRCPAFLIDPAMSAPHPAVRLVAARAEEALPEVARRLGATR